MFDDENRTPSALSSPAVPSATKVHGRQPIVGRVQRVLITGMSATGKSTVIRELARLGYKAIDTDGDEAWEEEVSDGTRERVWTWREDRIQALLSTEDADVLFISSTVPNQGKFYSQFDHIVLLSAPVPVTLERLRSRTNNPYGKHPDEVDRVLGYKQTVEPLLRQGATVEIDTSRPLSEVLAAILDLAAPRQIGEV